MFLLSRKKKKKKKTERTVFWKIFIQNNSGTECIQSTNSWKVYNQENVISENETEEILIS